MGWARLKADVDDRCRDHGTVCTVRLSSFGRLTLGSSKGDSTCCTPHKPEVKASSRMVHNSFLVCFYRFSGLLCMTHASDSTAKSVRITQDSRLIRL